MLRRKACSLLHSIPTVAFSTSTSTSAVDFLQSYTVTPPIKDWPQRPLPKAPHLPHAAKTLFITLIRNYGRRGPPKLAFRTFIAIPKFRVQRSVRSLECVVERFGSES
ncbi:hypothetical protein M0R45_035235 [Rubus argutus]|uniref:Uncharacterized protein n=1 Tax=Rubus argutus TaxID=59490 RepID=A0AAW1VWR1_RUBAR